MRRRVLPGGRPSTGVQAENAPRLARLRRWWPHLLLGLLALALLWELEHGEGGRHELAEVQARVAAQQAENARLQQRNAALAADVAELKSGEAAVEDRARAELGMIRPGETFYRVVEPVPAAVPASAEAPR